MAGKFLSIPTPWWSDDIGMKFCPVCGQIIFEEPTCEHLMFIYLAEAGEFGSVAPAIEPLLERLPDFDECEGDACPPEALMALIPSESALCFNFPGNVTGGGISVCIEFVAQR